AFRTVGDAIGGAIGSGAFFTKATPTVTISDSNLHRNEAQGGSNLVTSSFGADAGNARGGAIGASAGAVTISRSTIRRHLAESRPLFQFIQGGTVLNAAGSSAEGGGIDDEFDFRLSFLSPTLRITDSTITGNVALGEGPFANGFGGGLNKQSIN